MRDGADVIVQGRLENGTWAGWADVLLRVDARSRFGDWKYEPVETKLATTTRAATLIQLCLYADLLAEAQGASPEILRVVVPERKFKPECYRYDEFRAYYRLVRRNFETEMARPLPASADQAEPYPDPVAHCDMCNWYGLCDKRGRRDDHVSLVAGIHKTQRKELASWGSPPWRHSRPCRCLFRAHPAGEAPQPLNVSTNRHVCSSRRARRPAPSTSSCRSRRTKACRRFLHHHRWTFFLTSRAIDRPSTGASTTCSATRIYDEDFFQSGKRDDFTVTSSTETMLLRFWAGLDADGHPQCAPLTDDGSQVPLP